VNWEPVIGLEIHVQLKTQTKMFCRCPVGFGARENAHTCPVCLAHPGALPVPNRAAIDKTILLGLALGCEIAERAVFARKNYSYPDLPKGYQISQYDRPLCVNGHVSVPEPDGTHEIGIVRAHLEEDAAKNVHEGGSEGRISGATATLVDFNRGGTPLVEIVSAPDIRSAEEAKRFLLLLRRTVVELGLSDAELEKGSMRFDVNVSVRPEGSDELRTRTELKNMNSFNFAAKGIEREIARQVAVYESGGQVEQETLHFVPGHEDSPPLRSKEEAQDYRYFPDPDLVPVQPSRQTVEELRASLPELPADRLRRLLADYELPFYDAEILNDTPALARLFEGIALEGVDAKAASNVLMNQFAATGVDPGAVDAAELAKLVAARGEIPRAAFADALAAAGDPDFRAETYLAETAIADESALDPIIDRILDANPGQVEQFRGGKEGLLGFFVGQVMRETQGKANAKVVNERLREKLRS
jgi:aspartyl-tRNA(Asn)/glutamyl-tRNA(Gln) amidotransferase subunit B